MLSCFHCGEKLSEESTTLACDPCAIRGGWSRLGLYSLESSGQTSKDLSSQQVLNRWRRGTCRSEDRVSLASESALPLDQHPDFLPHFIAGQAEKEKLDAMQQREAASRKRRKRSRIKGQMTKLLAGLGVTCILLLAWQQREQLSPWLDQGIEELTQLGIQGVEKTQIAFDEDKARQHARSIEGPPGDQLLESLKAQYPQVQDSLESLLAQGEVALREESPGGYQAARVAFGQALVLSSDSAPAWRGLALSLIYSQSDSDRMDALPVIKRVRSLEEPVLELYAQLWRESSSHDRLTRVLEDCLEESPQSAVCLALKGEQLPGPEGRALLRESIRLDPERGLSYRLLADHYLGEQLPAHALEVLDERLRQQPQDEATQLHRAMLLLTLMVPGDRGDQLKAALSLDSSDLALTLATARRELLSSPKDCSLRMEALVSSHRGEGPWPGMDEAETLYAQCLSREGRHQESLGLAKSVLERDPEHQQALLLSAQSEQALGRSPEALAHLESVLETELEGMLGARMALEAAWLYLQLDQPSASLRMLEIAREQQPQWPRVWLEELRILLVLEQLPKLVQSMEQWPRLETVHLGRWEVLQPNTEPLDLSLLAERLDQALGQDVLFQVQQQRLSGALRAMSCVLESRSCEQAKQLLENHFRSAGAERLTLHMLAWMAETRRPPALREALGWLQEDPNLSTLPGELLAWQGDLHLQTGDPVEAVRLLQRAEKRTMTAGVRLRQARLAARDGDLLRQQALLREVLEEYPYDRQSLHELLIIEAELPADEAAP